MSATFFAKISASGDKIIYAGGVSATTRECGAGSTCFLSKLITAGVSIAVDPAGNAYIAGNANGTGLPATAGALAASGIGAFVMKVNAAGTGLVYLTMLGSATAAGDLPGAEPGNTVTGIAADDAGNAYISGYTSDPAFPATSGAFQPALAISASQPQTNPELLAPPDAFIAKLNPQGTAMVWASFLEGTQADKGAALAVDSSGDVWVSGTTSSADFPVSAGFPQGQEFLAEFNPAGSALLYGARFPANTVSTAVAVDASGAVHAAGSTGLLTEIPPAQSAAPYLFGVANAAGGRISGRLAPSEVISIYGEHFGVASPQAASFNSAGLLPDNFYGVEVVIGGTPAPLLYVSDNQINAVAPAGLATGPAAMQVLLGSTSLPRFLLQSTRLIRKFSITRMEAPPR